MGGRVEDEIKMFKSIEKEIVNYPDFIIDWYFNLKANECTSTTCRDFLNKVKQYMLFINSDIKRITPSDFTKRNITQYFIKIQTKEERIDGKIVYVNTSDSYKQCVWSCLNNLFNFLENEGRIEINLIKAAKIKRPTNKDLDRINKNRVLLTKEDFKKIIDVVNKGTGSKKAQSYQKKYRNRDLSIMLILMTTGIRRNALREINIEDIDFDNNKLTVIDKRRVIHEYSLNTQTIKVLNEWLTDRYFLIGGNRNEKALFISRDAERISGTSVAELVDKYSMAALGYHISPHKLRSGLASIMYEESGDIEFVRRVIGHSNTKTTQRYIVTDNKEREKASNLMEDFLS